MRFAFQFGLLVVACVMGLPGCKSAGEHAASLHSAQDRRMTVGVVQKEIRVGMPQSEVVAALGSPNIVTRDLDGRESWVYDKIATEASYSSDTGGIGGAAAGGGVPGGSALVLGGVGSGYRRSAGATATTQRTLTVIIKYDQSGLVESFSYHSSSF